MREVQLISRLNHENVVRYAFNEIITDGVAFMHKLCVQTRNKFRWSALTQSKSGRMVEDLKLKKFQ